MISDISGFVIKNKHLYFILPEYIEYRGRSFPENSATRRKNNNFERFPPSRGTKRKAISFPRMQSH